MSPPDPDWFPTIALVVTFLALITAAGANVMYSRPRIEKLEADRDEERKKREAADVKIAELSATNREQGASIRTLQEAPQAAVAELAKAIAAMTGKIIEDSRSLARELVLTRQASTEEHKALLVAIEAMANRSRDAS